MIVRINIFNKIKLIIKKNLIQLNSNRLPNLVKANNRRKYQYSNSNKSIYKRKIFHILNWIKKKNKKRFYNNIRNRVLITKKFLIQIFQISKNLRIHY